MAGQNCTVFFGSQLLVILSQKLKMDMNKDIAEKILVDFITGLSKEGKVGYDALKAQRKPK